MMPRDCPDHKPIQHRDGKPPWCPRCGLTSDFQTPTSIFDKYKENEMSESDTESRIKEKDEAMRQFNKELSSLINKYSLESASGTPDFILANYLQGALSLFEFVISERAEWRGESVELPSLQVLHRDAESGQFVTEKYTEDHPDTTVTEH